VVLAVAPAVTMDEAFYLFFLKLDSVILT